MPGKRLWFLFLPILAVQVFLAYFNNEDERPNMRRPMPDQYQPRPAPYARPGTVLKERSRFDPAFTVDVTHRAMVVQDVGRAVLGVREGPEVFIVHLSVLGAVMVEQDARRRDGVKAQLKRPVVVEISHDGV